MKHPSQKKRVENIEEFFIDLVLYWANRLKVGQITFVVKYNMEDVDACVDIRNDLKFLYFNPKKLVQSNYDKIDLLALCLHELGHLKKNAMYINLGEEEAEFVAESFCLANLKKYHPAYYEEYVKRTVEELRTNKIYGYHKRAFCRIPQYKKGLNNDYQN